MKTYQDLLKTTDKEAFIINAINEYKMSDVFKWAIEGDAYSRQMNTAIMRYKKLLYTISGKAVPDNYSANHKCASNFFDRFVTQETQYLLGNGITFDDDSIIKKLGKGKKSLDNQIQLAGKNALIMGVSFGFFNLDHIDVFKATEFVPLWDEETGALMAGIRFWQISPEKPLRATLYELDGYTDYIRKDGQSIEILREKRAYKLKVRTSVIDGTEIYDGENYPSFPIVPLWANSKHQSELVGIKGQIDAYDLIKSGFANDLDDASMIYWTIENAGGMDDVDLAKFIERMKTVKAAAVDIDGARPEPHTIDVPYQSRESYLARLEVDLYNDAMALNVQAISSGNITATAIRAAYQSLDDKVDGFEYCVTEFIKEMLRFIGKEDSDPIYKRNRVANMTEETQMVLSAAQYLDNETILKHLPFLSPDEISGILNAVTKEEADRFEEVAKENADLKEQLDGRGEELDGRTPEDNAEQGE